MALEPTPLNLRIAPAARAHIESFIAATGRADAVATLMIDVNKRWSIGAYYRENIEGLTPKYQENGWPFFIRATALLWPSRSTTSCRF